MRKKTETQKKYEDWVEQKMKSIDTPQELLAFIKQEHAEKTKKMNEALAKLSALLGGDDGK